MRRTLVTLVTGGLLLVGSLGFAAGATAATVIAETTTCSNGVPNTAGLGLICEVTIVNTITRSGGSATVTVRECHGAAGDPEAACATVTDTLTSPVSVVNQCNDALNGGGATVRCRVRVTNNFVGVAAGGSAATVNQCDGSGDGVANNCDPFPSTVTGATITQCNGSANGGTLVNLECTASGRTSSTFRVTVNQCNGSANGGGSLVICSAIIRNTGGTVPSATPRPTTPPTDTPATTAASDSGSAPVVVVAILLFAFVVGGRRSLRAIRGR